MSYNRLENSEEVEAMGKQVQAFITKFGAFKKLCSKHDPRNDSLDLREQISEQRKELSNTSKTILHEMDNLKPSPDKRKKLEKISNEFQEILKKYHKECDDFDKRGAIPIESDSAERSGSLSLEHRQSDAFQNVEQLNQFELRKREEEVKHIESDMVKANAMFKEVAKMVKEQEDPLFNAEKNVDVAIGETEKAVVELQKANRFSQKAKRRMCIILIIAIIFIIVLVFIILASQGKL